MDTNPQTAKKAKKAKSRRKLRRILASALALAIGLTATGVLVNALTPTAQVATAQPDEQALIQQGKDLYDVACVTCHGTNLQGIEGRGPSLIGVGSGAVYFQVHSGRMPMLRNEAQAARKTPRYTEAQTLAIAAYVAANGGGPEIVYNEDGTVAQESLRGANYDGKINPADVARGSDLFRLNCASCHNFTGRGGALSSGKYAPYLDPANEQEIYQAMLSGSCPPTRRRTLSPSLSIRRKIPPQAAGTLAVSARWLKACLCGLSESWSSWPPLCGLDRAHE